MLGRRIWMREQYVSLIFWVMKMFDTEMFISEVEKRPALYNARHKEYSDRDLKYKLWDEIAAAMYKNWETLPGQECRKKGKSDSKLSM